MNGLNGKRRTGAKHSMCERDTDKTAEMSQRPKETGGGTADGLGAGCQTRTACRENAGDGSSTLMQEVLRRENLIAARNVLRKMGLVSFLDEYRRLVHASRTAGYGTVRPVVWSLGRATAPATRSHA